MNRSAFRLGAVLAASAVAAGCTSYASDFMHPMKIETRTADGSLVAGAACELRNDKVALAIKSGDTIGVRRSNQPLAITCKHATHGEARAEARPTVNAGMIGNVLFGGGLGGVFDRTSAASAYAYPAWVQLVFGRSLVFDRGDEKDVSQPTPPRPSAS